MTQEQLVIEYLNGAVDGVSQRNGNLKIKEDKLIHYQTTIAQRKNGVIILNDTRYSIVTGRIQKMVKERAQSYQLLKAHKVPEGFQGDLEDYIIK